MTIITATARLTERERQEGMRETASVQTGRLSQRPAVSRAGLAMSAHFLNMEISSSFIIPHNLCLSLPVYLVSSGGQWRAREQAANLLPV